MRLKPLQERIAGYVFTPPSPYPLAAFRICLGLCVCATLLLLRADWTAWFGAHGWITLDTMEKAEDGFRLNVFAFLPQDDLWVHAVYWIFLGASVAFTLGFWSRFSSVLVFLGLNSLNQRMPLILHGGDTFLRSAAFFLMFSRSGAAWSLDSLSRRRRSTSKQGGTVMVPPWPQCLIQFQLAIVYLASFLWKAKGKTWWNGSAMFYVLNLHEIQRFPVPGFFHLAWMMHLESWMAMAFEFLFPLLVWFKPFRLPLLLAGLMFHLSLEYALNIPMFQWDILSGYVLFLGPELELFVRRRWRGERT